MIYILRYSSHQVCYLFVLSVRAKESFVCLIEPVVTSAVTKRYPSVLKLSHPECEVNYI